MISAIEAKQLSETSNTNLSFILDLIDEAISVGKYSIIIEDYRMTDEVSGRLRDDFGYVVHKQMFESSIHGRYSIIWSDPIFLPGLELMFNNISNANMLVGDSSNVGDWNTFFDLPTYGSPFTSVYIIDDVVNLIGGSNIETIFGLFSFNTNLLEVDDKSNCVVTLGDESFR